MYALSLQNGGIGPLVGTNHNCLNKINLPLTASANGNPVALSLQYIPSGQETSGLF
jgi:hypothetical protein